jgi:hypothetical protein
MDQGGNVIGVVTSKLDALKLAQRIGDIPQNVNFAIKAEVLERFLDGRRLSYSEDVTSATLPVADVADLARAFTVQVECSPASSAGQVERPELPGGESATSPAPPPTPSKPPPAPSLPAPSATLPDWVRAIVVVEATTPFPASAPGTRQLTLENGSDRRVYELTVAWLTTDSERPCDTARDRFAGQRTIFAGLAPGGRATVYGEFPPAARAFCVVDAKGSVPPTRREPAPAPEPPAAEPPDR